jgi:hypothetical protein
LADSCDGGAIRVKLISTTADRGREQTPTAQILRIANGGLYNA